ncbi:MAG: hypothetical protein V4472_23130 [Pseudomonadota bacterium]
MKNLSSKTTFLDQAVRATDGTDASYDALFDKKNHGYRKEIMGPQDFFEDDSLGTRQRLIDRHFSKNPLVRLGLRIQIMFEKT